MHLTGNQKGSTTFHSEASACPTATSSRQESSQASLFLPNTEIELIHPIVAPRRLKTALFDFDGTLSLIREGWPDVMIPMMVRVLQQTGTSESERLLYETVEEFVMRLNGRQTVYQMIQLADEVRARGGTPLDALEYKRQYHELLWQRIKGRVQGLHQGTIKPVDMTVPGSHAVLTALRQRGLTMYLASGTDIEYVRNEAAAIGVAHFFEPHIYGAIDDYKNFSKKIVIDRIMSDHSLRGDELIGFGDGFVEIEEVKRVGGLAVGVASDEARRCGVNPWKRRRLIEAGADIIIPDYRHHADLLSYLLDECCNETISPLSD